MKLSLAIGFCLLATLDVGGALAQAPPPPDILGIQIGMSADNALKILNAHAAELLAQNVKMVIQPATVTFDVLPKPMGWGLSATTVPGKGAVPAESIIVVFTMPPNPQVVAEVHRDLDFTHSGNKPAKDALLASLREKYGPESVRGKNPTDIMHHWAFQDGRQQFFESEYSDDHVYLSVCDSAIAGPLSNIGPSGGRYQNLDTILMRGFSADVKSRCAGHSHVNAMTNFDYANDGLVNSFSVSILDVAMEDAAMEKTRTMLQNLAEQKRQEEINKGKTSRPKL
jgi:hypothetical protein